MRRRLTGVDEPGSAAGDRARCGSARTSTTLASPYGGNISQETPRLLAPNREGRDPCFTLYSCTAVAARTT
jgi:hypothetical protein